MKKSQSYSRREMELKGEGAQECGNYSLFFLTLESGMSQSLSPFWEEVGKSHIVPLVLADNAVTFIWSSPCPCHVPASAPHSHTDSTGRLEIIGRCVHRQTAAAHLVTGKTVWRQGHKSE